MNIRHFGYHYDLKQREFMSIQQEEKDEKIGKKRDKNECLNKKYSKIIEKKQMAKKK